VPTITKDYEPKVGLHIKTKGRLNATSLGIGYRGDGARADCYALAGDAVNGSTAYSTYWVSARNLRTQVKGYSAIGYTYFPGLSKVPAGFNREAKDTCWFKDKAGLY
jgi:hypothetical protein